MSGTGDDPRAWEASQKWQQMSLDALRKLAQSASPAPWEILVDHERGNAPYLYDASGMAVILGDLDAIPEDGDLIVAMRNTYEALLDVAEAAEELKLWEPGRVGYAAAQRKVFDALARLHEAAQAQAAGGDGA